MSVESLAIALHHSRAKGTAKLILIGLANHDGDGDGGAWPSIATLSKYAGGQDRRNIHRALARLEELGEIKRDINAGGNALTRDYQRPNLYHFLLKCPAYCDHTSQHRDARKPLITFEDDPGAKTPPEPSLNPATTVKEITRVLNRVRAREQATCERGHRLIDDRHCEMGCLISEVA